MMAAIYARKSTEQNVAEDAKSVTRQVEHARAFADAKGWTVDDRYVFVDEAVSGAEWKHRHGWNALLAALEPRPPFSVLIVSELSRIGRDSVRTPAAVQQVEEAGVEIRSYLSDAPITLTSETGEMSTMLGSLLASFERRRARERTYDALRRRADVFLNVAPRGCLVSSMAAAMSPRFCSAVPDARGRIQHLFSADGEVADEILAVAVLKSIGPRRISPDRIAHLRKVIPHDERARLLKGVRLAPSWMRPYLIEIATNQQSV